IVLVASVRRPGGSEPIAVPRSPAKSVAIPRLHPAAVTGHADCMRMAGAIALPAREGRTPSFFHPTRRRFAMPATYNILILGASYGSLLASKLLFGGPQVKLV